MLCYCHQNRIGTHSTKKHKGNVYIDTDLMNVGNELLELLTTVAPVYVTVKGNSRIHGRSWEMAASKIITGEPGKWTGTVEDFEKVGDNKYIIHYGRVIGTELKRRIMKDVNTSDDDASDSYIISNS